MTTAFAAAHALAVALTRVVGVTAQVALAGLVLSGAVVLGHELREWREWYADPATAHPWAPTPAPSPTPGVVRPEGPRP